MQDVYEELRRILQRSDRIRPLNHSEPYRHAAGGKGAAGRGSFKGTQQESRYLDRSLGADLAAIGEIGLSGEIRSVSALNQRLSEISRLGFRRCVIPAHGRDELRSFPGLTLIPVRNISEAIASVLARE